MAGNLRYSLVYCLVAHTRKESSPSPWFFLYYNIFTEVTIMKKLIDTKHVKLTITRINYNKVFKKIDQKIRSFVRRMKKWL